MIKIVITTFVALLLTAGVAECGDGPGTEPHGTAQSSERVAVGTPKETVAARVNGVEIPMSLLERLVKEEEARLEDKEHGEGNEKSISIRKQLLDRLISEELVYQKATAEGIKADPEKIDNELKELRTKFGGAEEFEAALKKVGFTEADVRANIERKLVFQQFFKREITDKITVSEEMIKKAYEKGKSNFVIPGAAQAVDIVFFLDPHKEESFRKVEAVRKAFLADKSKGPHEFSSDGTFVAIDVELSDKSKPNFFEYAKELKPGEYSPVITTEDSLHILQLKSYTPGKQLTLGEVKNYLREKIGSEETANRMKTLQKDLRKEAKIEIYDTDTE